MKKIALLSMLFVVLFLTKLYAGGPLNTFKGRAVVYKDFPVSYHVDKSTLGSFSNDQAVTLTHDCFQVWEDVETATITFQGGSLPEEVTKNNYWKYLDNHSDGYNPIVFDTDGAIIDAEYGAGSSESIMGFAGSAYNPATGYYTEGVALLNGRFSYLGYDEFKGTFVHEFGHFIGLDHCQINMGYANDGNPATDIYVPTMYPTSLTDDSSLSELNPDDKAALTMLYPASNTYSVYGKIQGQLLWEDKEPVLGANVVVLNTADPDMIQFSSVSDYYEQKDGFFEMLVVPGSYRIGIEPVFSDFYGGSRVGPYAKNAFDISFAYPVKTGIYQDIITISSNETKSYTLTAPGYSPLCIASYLLGAEDSRLETLRNFRDDKLSQAASGREVVKTYYEKSGQLIELCENSPAIKWTFKTMLEAFIPVIGLFN